MLVTLDGHARARPDRTHLVVDEGQDLPQEFFTYATRHVSRTMSVFADEDQTLGPRGSTLAQIKAAAGLADPVMLTRNHRNTAEIARLAEHFHRGRLPPGEVVRSSSGPRPRLVRSPPDSDFSVTLIANQFRNLGGSIGVIVHRNETGHDLYRRLKKRLPRARVDMYAGDEPNEDSIDVLKPGVTVLNRESVKGQEFDAVIVELAAFIPCADEAASRRMYMMCARARDHLFLVYGPDDLTSAARRSLPGAEVLEGT